MEQLIEPGEYTPQTLELIEVLKRRMRDTLIEFTDDQISVFDIDDILYILANPKVGIEVVLDQDGHEKIVSMYNITLIKDNDRISTGRNDKDEWSVSIKQPRIRIFRPDLCIRIKSGEVVTGSL